MLQVITTIQYAKDVLKVATSVFGATIKDAGLATSRDFSYSDDQTWVKTPAELRYHDETPDLVEIYEQESPDPPKETPSLPVVSPKAVIPSPASIQPKRQRTLDANSPISTISSMSKPHDDTSTISKSSPASSSYHKPSFLGSATSLGILSNQPEDYPSSNYDTLDLDLRDRDDFETTLTKPYSAPSDSLSPTFLEHCIWPLTDVREAQLMRYYIDHISIWFDLCDAERHFALVIPQRAAYCPTLLNAIFAFSARHLNQTRDYDPYAADRYYEKCLNHLQKMFYDPAAIMDENLLAATIILRTMEEVDVAILGADNLTHLIGTKALITAQERSNLTGLLFEKLFFVALRQEVNVAFVQQRAIDLPLTSPFLDRSLLPTDDCSWANRMVVHCSDALNYCFGSESHHSTARWEELQSYQERCLRSIPSSFEPIYFSPTNEEKPFPEIWLQHPWHTTGLQHHLLAKILLTVYNPKLPRLGPSQRSAQLKIDEDVKQDIRTLCGMALSNQDTPPNMISAFMGISVCGDKFTKLRDQEALLDVLVRTEKRHGWPTGQTQGQLKEAWGWESRVEVAVRGMMHDVNI
ncbi:MAG: hypothetical protein M1834_000405 [Cirrosporium novae-zelandiae]|nr:MAG: hypothetical protein M1834_000405 [Cirrosporium novae-zelandiae]